MKNIAFITTTNHNVGDDFVREGLKFLLRKKFGGEEIVFESVHKHSPITSRHGFEWFRTLRYSKRVDALLPLFLTRDRILEADLIVQCGAPVYWCHMGSHCADNEWFGPLIERRLSLNGKAKLLNLAAGTCQTYHSDGSEIVACAKDAAYIRKLTAISAATTVRDSLGKNVLRSLGLNAPLIPCSSIFAAEENGVDSEDGDFIAVNYMPGGGHYSFGQQIDAAKWRKDFSSLYSHLKTKGRVVFACHNAAELSEAKSIDPQAETFSSPSFVDYIRFYAKAKIGVMNRVHGAFMLASLGKPSIVIGSDTRAKMAMEIGLSSHFVGDVSFELLKEEVDRLEKSAPSYRAQMAEIKKKAFKSYMDALDGFM